MFGPQKSSLGPVASASSPSMQLSAPFGPSVAAPTFAPLSAEVSAPVFAPASDGTETGSAPVEGEVGAPWTGMWVLPAKEEEAPTIFIRPCAPGSPAENAGLAGGDEILAVDDDSALGPDGYGACFANWRSEGDVMRFDVRRGGVPLSLFLVVDRRPPDEEGG